MTLKLLEAACIEYTKSTRSFKGMFFDTKNKAKAKKEIQALKQTNYEATYTHKFTLHSHQKENQFPTLISQCTQGVKENVWVYPPSRRFASDDITQGDLRLWFQGNWSPRK